MSISNFKLGRIGERDFCSLCDKGMLTPNMVQEDVSGWDIYVEFPLEFSNSYPPDLQISPIEMKVQVKSTLKSSRSKNNQIKISNLIKLVKTKLPSFLCFMEYNDNENLERIYLVHIDQKIMERVLKKVRELYKQGEANVLNKHKLTIPYQGNDKLEEISGECLKRTIKKFIPKGIDDYVKAKLKLLSTLGFEDGKQLIKFQVPDIFKLIDLSLGQLDELPIENIRGYHQRFGIESPDDQIQHEKGILTVPDIKPNRYVNVHVRRDRFSPNINLSGNLFLPPVDRSFPLNFIRYRVETEFIDFIIDHHKSKIDVSFNFFNKPRTTFKTLSDSIKIFDLMCKSSTEIVVDITEKNSNELIFSAKMNYEKPNYELSQLTDIMNKSSQILKTHDISETNVLISLDDLLKHEIRIINYYNLVCNYKGQLLKLKFNLEEEANIKENNILCSLPITTIIGNQIITCLLGIKSKKINRLKDKQFEIVSTDLVTGRVMIVKDDEVIYKDDIIKEMEHFESEFENLGFDTIRILEIS